MDVCTFCMQIVCLCVACECGIINTYVLLSIPHTHCAAVVSDSRLFSSLPLSDCGWVGVCPHVMCVVLCL